MLTRAPRAHLKGQRQGLKGQHHAALLAVGIPLACLACRRRRSRPAAGLVEQHFQEMHGSVHSAWTPEVHSLQPLTTAEQGAGSRP